MTRTHTHFEKIKIKIKQFKCFTSFNPTRIETKDFDVFFFSFLFYKIDNPTKQRKVVVVVKEPAAYIIITNQRYLTIDGCTAIVLFLFYFQRVFIHVQFETTTSPTLRSHSKRI